MVLLVRAAEVRVKRDGERFLRLTLRRPHRAARHDGLGGRRARGRSSARRASPCASPAASSAIRSWGRSSPCAAVARAPEAAMTRPTCATAPRARSRRWRPTCATSSRRCRTRTSARCSSACSGRTPRPGRASAARLRPSSTTRPTRTGCSSTPSPSPRPSARWPRRSRGSTATSRSRGALLHDIGKLEAYTDASAAIDLTDFGRLQGEIPLGYYRIRRAIEDLPGFPAETAQALLHIILGHHGSLEHGSPVVPATREAWLVHMIDNLGGSSAPSTASRRAWRRAPRWTGFDRGVGASAYFGPPRAVPDTATPERRAA